MRRLVLVGAGHAHLELLRRLTRRRLEGCEVVLVDPDVQSRYTGMVPGYLAGAYEERDLSVPLAPLCAAAGVRHVAARARAIDGGARSLALDAATLEFDLLSVNVGGAPAGWDDVPGGAEHALPLRPLANARRVRARVDALAAEGGPVHVVVAGAGAAGVEVAFCLHARIAARGGIPQVVLVDAAEGPLPDRPPEARRLVRHLLRERGIALYSSTRVTAVDPGAVTLGDGRRVPAALTVWVAGTAAPPLFTDSALPRDEQGFLLVDETLRAADGLPVWGAGDCVSIVGHPELARAGVYAVRAAPTLAHNLRAALDGGTLRRFRPERDVLALLNTADGRAVLLWKGAALHGRAAWWLKDRIDRRWIGRFGA